VVEVSWRSVADLEELEAEDHVAPSGTEIFDSVVVLVQKGKGAVVGVG